MNNVEMAYSVVNAPNIVCDCGSKLFEHKVILKHISALVSPTGKDEIVDIPVFVCASCGQVPNEYKTKANYKLIFGEKEVMN